MFNVPIARIIALDAGSSQIIVNKAYLVDTKLSSNLIKQVLKEVGNFYIGEP